MTKNLLMAIRKFFLQDTYGMQAIKKKGKEKKAMIVEVGQSLKMTLVKCSITKC